MLQKRVTGNRPRMFGVRGRGAVASLLVRLGGGFEMVEELDRSGLAVVFLGYAASLPFIASIALNPHPHVNVSLQVSSLIMLVWGVPLFLLGAILFYRVMI